MFDKFLIYELSLCFGSFLIGSGVTIMLFGYNNYCKSIF